MLTPASRVLALALCLLAAACSTTRQLPKYERPLARAPVQSVRTTAYTHTEGDHLQYSDRNACGDRLQSGTVKSAACDWSRWPVGTLFRVRETGEDYVVDDYGWALAGTNTIDLYKPSRSAMNSWGVRRVNIEIVQWGDVRRSLAILQPRMKHRHVQRMVSQIKSRYDELSKPLPGTASDRLAIEIPPAEEPPAVAATVSVPRAVAVTSSTSATSTSTGGFTPSNSGRPRSRPFPARAKVESYHAGRVISKTP